MPNRIESAPAAGAVVTGTGTPSGPVRPVRWRSLLGAVGTPLAGVVFAIAFGLKVLGDGISQNNGHPVWLIVAVLLLAVPSAVLAWRGLVADPTPTRDWLRDNRHVALTIAALGGFAVALWVVGFLLSSLVFLLGLMWLLGARRPIVLGGTTAVMAVLIVGVFQELLDVDLPSGLLGLG